MNLRGTSLLVQRGGLRAPNAGGPGSIPGQGTRSCMPQLRARMPQLKIPQKKKKEIPHAAMKILCATTKTGHSQINKQILFFFKKDESKEYNSD